MAMRKLFPSYPHSGSGTGGMLYTDQEFTALFQYHSWYLAGITILYWDHLLTLKTEARCLWKRPSNASGYLFYINRYFNALGALFGCITLFYHDLPLSCKDQAQFREVILIVAQLIVVLILTLRIYALYSCSKRLLWFMLSVIAVLLSVVIFSTFYFSGGVEYERVYGRCIIRFDLQTSIRKAIAWEMLLVYDVLLFSLAVHNAFKTRRELKMLRMLKNTASLKVILLRDGAMYFGVMLLANLANIITYHSVEASMRGGLAGFSSSLSVTMVSRLMLNLHEVMDTGIYLSQLTSQTEGQHETQIVFYQRRPTTKDLNSFDDV